MNGVKQLSGGLEFKIGLLFYSRLFFFYIFTLLTFFYKVKGYMYRMEAHYTTQPSVFMSRVVR
jgi:hypothetical protein